MKPTRIWVIAQNVFWETIRDRILYLAGLFAVIIVAAAALLPQVAAGTEDKILLDVGLAALGLIGLIVAVFVGTGLVNKEIEKRTVLVLIAKPVSRSEFIVGKHIGLSAVILVLLTVMSAIYLGVLSLNQIAYPLESILLSLGFLFLELSLIVAVAILFGVFTSSLLATLLTFAVYLMGHFSQDLVALSQLSENPDVQRVVQGLYLVLPDLSRLTWRNQAIYGLELFPAPPELLAHAGYGILYTFLLLLIATFIFSRREF